MDLEVTLPSGSARRLHIPSLHDDISNATLRKKQVCACVRAGGGRRTRLTSTQRGVLLLWCGGQSFIFTSYFEVQEKYCFPFFFLCFFPVIFSCSFSRFFFPVVFSCDFFL